jgi:hypothetical protein
MHCRMLFAGSCVYMLVVLFILKVIMRVNTLPRWRVRKRGLLLVYAGGSMYAHVWKDILDG